MNSMEETDDSSRNDMMQRLQFSFSSNPLQRYPFQNQSPPSNPFSNPSQIRSSALLRHLPQSDAATATATANKRGIPPVSPYRPPSPAQNPPSGGGGPNPQPCHTRSLSQPAFYSFDSFPPLSPSPYKDSSSPSPSATSDPVLADVSMDDGGNRDALPPSPAPLPPRKAAHRRSLSEVSFSFPGLGGALSAAAPPPLSRPFDRPIPPAKLVKQESSDWEKDVGDRGDPKSDEDLFAAYMNLEQIDTLNSSGTDDKREDLDSRASGSRTNGVDSSDNEAESSLSTQRGGNPSPNVSNNHHKRSHAGGDVGAPRHCRSISMDSFIMGKMNFGDESPNIPPSPGPRLGQHSHSNTMDGVTNSTFSLDFGNGEFSTSDLKKIMANEKLAEMAMVDPKRVKRILANRQSAARSKERKMRYISELEQKVQTLQTEATTLSAQLTLLQRDSAGLTNQNNELKFRLQAMEQQAQLRDALNEALTAEVQRLKLATAELGDSHSNSLNHHVSTNNQFFQMQQQQSSQPSVYQLQQRQQQQQQQQQHLSPTAANNESKS